MEELAQRANTTASQINKLEKGYVKLSWDWMQRLGRALECHPGELLPLFQRPELSAEEQALLDRYRGLSEEDRQAVFRVADAFKRKGE